MSVTIRIENDRIETHISSDFLIATRSLSRSNDVNTISHWFSVLSSFLCDSSEHSFSDEYSFQIGKTLISPDFNMIFESHSENGDINLSNTNFINFMDMIGVDINTDDLTGSIPTSMYPQIIRRIVYLENTHKSVEKSSRPTVTQKNLVYLGVTTDRLREVLSRFKTMVLAAKKLNKRIIWD